ncbi:putative signal transducing protein [Candidatus Uabimicrobium sp. HlEnr_7]|uniref:putative signal transducing protein n=1 Tax=Candidatus Uabimicrobium helgolandensis TaxID=3095367 RepID=UPI003558B5E9
MSRIICVKKFANRLEAELAKSLLESKGIMANVSADDSGGMEMMPVQLIGGVELLVLEDRLEEALNILRV